MLARETCRVAAQANGRNVVARLRPVACRRAAPFKGVRSPSVRVFAEAAGAAEAAPKAMRLEDIAVGTEYEGTVTAVENFGAFVDFGAGTNGLVHISKLQAGFTKNARDVVSPGQKVTVKVLSVDPAQKRVSLELSGAVAGSAPAADAADDGEEKVELLFDGADDAGEGDADDEVEVELEEGQVEVYAQLPGFEDIPFVMEEEDAEEINEASLAAMEADMDAVEIQYNLDAPAYMEEVTGKVERIEEYGVFLSFSWNGKTLTGLLSRDEMKVPSALLSEDKQAALRAEWADTEFDMPAYAELPDDQIDVKKYYKPGDEVPAFVLETELVGGRGIALTHYTDEEVAAEAVEAWEGLEEDDDDELDRMIAEAEDSLGDEVLAVTPEALLEAADEDEDEVAVANSEDTADYEGLDSEQLETATGAYEAGATRAGLIKGKNGYQVAPLGLPSRPTIDAVNSSGMAILGTSETDFDGDVVQLVDYWSSEAYDNIPKDILKRMGLKMSVNDQGEAEFTEREGFEEDASLPIFMFAGDVEARAKEFVEDLLDDETDEAEVPARAYRRPGAIMAAAVQSQ